LENNLFGVDLVVDFEILECAPLKVLGLILFNVNFGGQVHTELCSGFNGVHVSGR